MCSGKSPVGAAQGKQTKSMASCQTPSHSQFLERALFSQTQWADNQPTNLRVEDPLLKRRNTYAHPLTYPFSLDHTPVRPSGQIVRKRRV